PLDDQRVAPLDRRPGVARNDRDAADRLELRWRRRTLYDDDLLDTRHFHCRAAVIGGELAVHDRRPRNDRIFQPSELGIDAVDSTAGRDIEKVNDLDVAFAEIAEAGFVLELDLVGGRCRQCARRGGEVPISELAARGLVDDLMVLCLHLAY